MLASNAFNLMSSLFFLAVLLSLIHISISLPTRPHFDSTFVLIGDAKLKKDPSFIQLTHPRSSISSSGLVVQRTPIKFLTSNSKTRRPISFSTDFTFSISPHSGDGLAFLVVPRSCLPKLSREGFGVSKESRFFAVEFDTSMDDNMVDVNANHVGVDVGSLVSAKTSNVSSIKLVLNNGIKLRSWIDYDSSSKRLEVRLSRFGDPRPYNPLLVYQVDLGEMWRNEEVLVGLSSSTGDSLQISRVYSWKFRTWIAPTWLHSKPLDPNVLVRDEKLTDKNRICVLGLLSGVVFLTGCGLLLALVVIILWAMFENSSETLVMVPQKYNLHPGDFKYDKINIVVGDEVN